MNTVLESNSALKTFENYPRPQNFGAGGDCKKSIIIHACQPQWKSQVLMRHTFDVKEDFWRETLLLVFTSLY